MDVALVHHIDLVFVLKEVTSNRLFLSALVCLSGHVLTSFSGPVCLSPPLIRGSVTPVSSVHFQNTHTHTCTESIWLLRHLSFCLEILFFLPDFLTSSPSFSLRRTRKLQIRNIPPHLQWEVSSYFLFYFSCWDHLQACHIPATHKIFTPYFKSVVFHIWALSV